MGGRFFEQVAVLDAVTSVTTPSLPRFFTLFRSPSPAVVSGGQRCAKSMRPFGCDACDGSTSSEYWKAGPERRERKPGRRSRPRAFFFGFFMAPPSHSFRAPVSDDTQPAPKFRPLAVTPEDLEGWTARRPSSHTRRVYPDSLVTAAEHPLPKWGSPSPRTHKYTPSRHEPWKRPSVVVSDRQWPKKRRLFAPGLTDGY